MTFFNKNFADAPEYGNDSRYTYFVFTGASESGQPVLSSLIIYHRLSSPMPPDEVRATAHRIYGITQAEILCWNDIATRDDFNTLFATGDQYVVDESVPLRRYSVSYGYENKEGAFDSDIIFIESHGMFNMEAVKSQIQADLIEKGAVELPDNADEPSLAGKSVGEQIGLCILDWATNEDLETADTQDIQ